MTEIVEEEPVPVKRYRLFLYVHRTKRGSLMDDINEVCKDFLSWIFTPTLAAKKAMDNFDAMLTGEEKR